ncbi:MAG: AsmA-like C-terminal domain-containing protein [Desulfamplus sp.]|nr:AsmA-like C-terminal domain-containing protein [Desulfamplus sp.]
MGDSSFSDIKGSILFPQDGENGAELTLETGRADIIIGEAVPWIFNLITKAPKYFSPDILKYFSSDILKYFSSDIFKYSSQDSLSLGRLDGKPPVGTITLGKTFFKGTLSHPETWQYMIEGRGNGVIPGDKSFSLNSFDFILGYPAPGPALVGITRLSNINALFHDIKPISSLLNLPRLDDLDTPFSLLDGNLEKRGDEISFKGKFIHEKDIHILLDVGMTHGKIPDDGIPGGGPANGKIPDDGIPGAGPANGKMFFDDIRLELEIVEKGGTKAVIKSQRDVPFLLKGMLDTEIIEKLIKPSSPTADTLFAITGGEKFSIGAGMVSPGPGMERVPSYIIKTDRFSFRALMKFFSLNGITTPTINGKEGTSTPIINGKVPPPMDQSISLFMKNIIFKKKEMMDKHAFPMIAFEIGSFDIHNITLSPFNARLDINNLYINDALENKLPEKKTIFIDAMKLCGLDPRGTITINPHTIDISIDVSEKYDNIEPLLSCFHRGEKLMEGPFSINASITTSINAPITESTTASMNAPITESTTASMNAPITESTTASMNVPITESTTASMNVPITASINIPFTASPTEEVEYDVPDMDAIKKNLHGTIGFSSVNGRVFRLTLLSRILSIINISKLMKGEFPDIEQTGFAYDTIDIEGNFIQGRLNLERAVVKGLDMTLIFMGWIDPFIGEMELTCLIAPFKTADAIIEKIPLIGKLFDNRLISIPVKAWGAVDDPRVLIMHPSDVGQSLVNTMERILTAPFKIIERLP